MEIIKSQTVSFSGHRRQLETDRLDFTLLSDTIEKLYNEGYKTFISGMALGFDMIAAMSVIQLRIDHPDVKLIAAIPFKGQERKFDGLMKVLYRETLDMCDEVVVVSSKFSFSAYFKRNDYMLEKCSKLVCYYSGSSGGTKYTVEKAKALGIDTINIYTQKTQERP